MTLGTHAQKLDRWLGAEKVEQISQSMKDWYGPPIAMAGVPGSVWAHRGGDFRGPLYAGQYLHALDYAAHRAKQIGRKFAQSQMRQANAGFASLDAIITAATTGSKSRFFPYMKNGPTGVLNVSSSLWGVGPSPPVGTAPAAAPDGTAFDDAATGTFPFTNPTGGDTQHLVKAEGASSVAINTLLLYDLIFGVAKTMASTSTEAVTGVPTRYQSVTQSDPDYVGGNFLFAQVGGTALAATAHNWTVCTYLDQANAASTLPSLTGNSAAIVHRLDHPVVQWFAPLETGDVGVKALTQMQCSASVATGVVWFMIGHPIAFVGHPVANLFATLDGIMTAFNLVRIFDDACLAFLEVNKPATTATNYTGSFQTVAG